MRGIIRTARALRRRQTPAERRLWEALRNRKCDGLKFLRQHPIGPYVVDFYCAQHRVIVEVDGNVHDQLDVWAYDALRQHTLEDLGLAVLRLRNEDVMPMNEESIHHWIRTNLPKSPETPS
jgi:very-short-patch-repair endonuclease